MELRRITAVLAALAVLFAGASATPAQAAGRPARTAKARVAALGRSVLLQPGQELTPSLQVDTDRTQYTPLQTITVRWSGFPAGASGEVSILPAAQVPQTDQMPSNAQFLSGDAGSVPFQDLNLAPGTYKVWILYMTASPAAFVATLTFRVVPAKGLPPGTATTGGMYGERVWVTKTHYAPDQPIVVHWSGLPPDHTVEFWFAHKGAPLSIVPIGPYHDDGAASGSFALPSPGPGQTWQVQWLDLTAGLHTQRASLFTVGASHVPLKVAHYGCYFYFGAKGVWRSSIQYVVIESPRTYRTPVGPGALTYDESTQTLRMTSGPLKGRIAHFIQHSAFTGGPAVAFNRSENQEPNGKPTMDVGDTFCYAGHP